jgi:hypothetical protein
MQDLLVLWDAIFADGIGFDLVDFIFVAMLLYLRDHCECSLFFLSYRYISNKRSCWRKIVTVRKTNIYCLKLVMQWHLSWFSTR